MARIILRVLFVFSISFNVVFAVLLLTESTEAKPAALNLSGDQQTAVNQMHANIHKENEKIKQKIYQCQEKLVKVLKENPVNMEDVESCISEINDLQKEIQLNTVKEIIQVKQHLNTEQCNCLLESLNQKMCDSSKPCQKKCCNPQH